MPPIRVIFDGRIERFDNYEQINNWMAQVSETGINYVEIDGELYTYIKEKPLGEVT